MSLFSKLAGSAKEVLQSGKENTKSAVFKAAINPFIKKYGQLVSFRLDAYEKVMMMEIMLKGELQPMVVNIQRYDFIKEGEDLYMHIIELSSNRYWMDTVFEYFVEGRKIKLPRELHKPIQAFM
jgi:hypothetical protein